MAPKKRICDLKRSAKKFPILREQIEHGGWIPHVLCDASGMYWDGFTAMDKEDKLFGHSESVRKQMINMILDGFFGEEIKDVYIDQTHYWHIRDELITWPNQEAIAKKQLRILEISRKS